MLDVHVRSALSARLLAGRPVPLYGRLLTDTLLDGREVLMDPDTAEELTPLGLPAFVLSTDGEASDGNVLEQHWDLSRGIDAGGPGIPVLWSHDAGGALLGQWRELRLKPLDLGLRLVGRSDIDTGTPAGAEKMGQVRRGYVRAVSVGWQPGKVTRRGELDPADPRYRDPEQDVCDMPAEGLVMGSADAPNRLLEASLCAVPADAQAFVSERQQAAAERVLARWAHGAELGAVRAAAPLDLDGLLAWLRDDPRVRAFVRREIDARIAARLGAANSVPPAPPAPAGDRISDLFPARR